MVGSWCKCGVYVLKYDENELEMEYKCNLKDGVNGPKIRCK